MDAIQKRANSSAPKSLQVAAAVIGNALEWYDFVIFGFLTVVISKLFFPTDSQYTSLLLTTATFGAGFLMRPLGGILLGIYADRIGRKAALQLIIALMTIAIAIITFAPPFAAKRCRSIWRRDIRWATPSMPSRTWSDRWQSHQH
jgi:MFS family permease